MRALIARIGFCLGYFAFWMGYYAVGRLVFLGYHHVDAGRAGFGNIVGAITHGTRMDLPSAGGPSLVIFPLVGLSVFAPRVARGLITWLSMAFLVLVALLTAIDVELYRAWGFRIDGSIVHYFLTPREMLASTASSPVVLLTMIFLLLAALSVFAFRRLLVPAMRAWQRVPLPTSLAAIPLTGGLIWALYIPLHGGMQDHPINPSTVFFSRNAFANQAALNVLWNFLDGVSQHTYRTDNPYEYLPPAEAASVADSLLAPGGTTVRLLRIARPNILVIIWESMTSKVVERLAGVPGVTPNLDSLIREGVLFNHFYASGDRSPEGLTAVITGYPAQPTTEIIQLPRKVATLPGLPRDLATAGYQTRFFYGGDPAFSNFRSFAMATGFDSLVTEDAFAPGDRHSTWGADDHVVLARALGDLSQMRRPFFATLFTLDSHEPFTVPTAAIIPGSDERNRFLNAHAYTDRSIGDFIRRAKREPWWDSTLVVIVADHGHRLPVLDSLQSDRKWELFSIPMVWLGGALAIRNTVIPQVGNQTDLPATLLHQLGLDASKYTWSRDLLASATRSWAWFTFRDGFGFINAGNSGVTWDNIGRRVIAQSDSSGAGDIRAGEALLQQLMNDFRKR